MSTYRHQKGQNYQFHPSTINTCFPADTAGAHCILCVLATTAYTSILFVSADAFIIIIIDRTAVMVSTALNTGISLDVCAFQNG